MSLEIFDLEAIPLYNAMPQPELLVFHANEKFDAEGRLKDDTTRMLVQSYLAALAIWVSRFKA